MSGALRTDTRFELGQSVDHRARVAAAVDPKTRIDGAMRYFDAAVVPVWNPDLSHDHPAQPAGCWLR